MIHDSQTSSLSYSEELNVGEVKLSMNYTLPKVLQS